jgi:hypothetical protein
MPDLFSSVFATTSTTAETLSVGGFLACVGVALLIGLFLAYVHARSSRASKSFTTTIALLPAIVCVVIMMVNGNIGAGVAVAGAFSLVRFRSAPGTAREICSIFLAMGTGLICGMGYLGYAILFAVVLGFVMLFYNRIGLGGQESGKLTLAITIPEGLDYVGEFDDLFETFTSAHELMGVKTTNMGSMYKLTYAIVMRNDDAQQAFIDQLRCRNGNLEIAITHPQEEVGYEL